ncbi:MFS transporter [Spongiactinospora sp. 9N601]|uniref:MFS transporter n=1 Tax=Spongiactinospora sp. 9N601 TaxID=3375149 RepID=UPI00379202F2
MKWPPATCVTASDACTALRISCAPTWNPGPAASTTARVMRAMAAIRGAAVAAVFHTVALIRQTCAPRIAMTVTGIVTSGSAIFGVASPFLFQYLAEQYGFQIVFVVSAVLAGIAAIMVRALLPESPIKIVGRLDVVGAGLLGGGLAAVLSYISLGPEFGWSAVGPLALLAGGVALLFLWAVAVRRVPEPVIDLRNLSLPLVLTLLVVVLSTGAYQSMLQLFGLIAHVSQDEGLGYGLAADGSLGLLFALPSLGITIGGVLAGALATRVGPAWTLAGGVTIGMVSTVGMYLSPSDLFAAVVFAGLLGFTAGSVVTSGFNMATSVASADRQGVVTGLVQVMLSIGSVVMNVVGSAVLMSTTVTVGGVAKNSATGVQSYIMVAAGSFVVAMVVALVLARRQRFTPLLRSGAVSSS